MDIDTVNFNLEHTLSCGQVFRWKRAGDTWEGIISNQKVCATQTGSILSIDSRLKRDDIIAYFRLDEDLDRICESICRDEHIKKAVTMFNGLHLVRQDVWECLITYMCSTASSIPMIEKRLALMSEMFGHDVAGMSPYSTDSTEFPEPTGRLYSFPEPEGLAFASEQKLLECKLGFRAVRIKKAATAVLDGTIRLDRLPRLCYTDAKNELMKIDGIGEKVADCVLLFSCGKDEAFPVDTHISQIMRSLYFEGAKMSDKQIGAWAREYFGLYCGYAQQYLYHYKRMNFSK